MSKPSLQLIHCSNGIPPGAKRRHNGRGFRPVVIDGGIRPAPGEHSWKTALELFDLGLLVSRANYLAFVVAGLAALEHHGWADLQTEQSDSR